MQAFLKSSVFTALIGVSIATAYAQDTASPETDPVYLFNEICYTQVPDVGSIEDMAKEFEWIPLNDEKLESFTSVKTPMLLKGWDIPLEERIYRTVLVRSEPLASFVESFPDMADSIATSCTMVLDGKDKAQTIFDRMNVLIGKAPSSTNVPDDQLLTTTWSGGNEALKVFVFLKIDAMDRANLINVTIFANP